MHVFFLFAPAFRDWPLAVAREIHRRYGQARFSGLATGMRAVFEYVAKAEEPAISPLDCLDDLERQWLAAPVDLARLKRYEAMLGVETIATIVTADRQIGSGLVSGARLPPSRLVALAAKPDTIPRYVTGLLDYVFERLRGDPPDLVFCYAVAGAPAMALATACRHLNIPFAQLIHTRVGGRHIIDDTPEGLLGPVRRRFEQALQDPSIVAPSLATARKFLAEFRATARQPDYVAFDRQTQRRSHGLHGLARETLIGLGGPLLHAIKVRRNVLRAPSPLPRAWHRVSAALRARRVARSGIFRAPGDLPAGPFVYYPLHVDPEASTMVLAPMHTDQLAVVEALSKSRPMTMELVVKEHEPMLGLRPPGFYERLARFPGVVLASPFEDSLTLVKNASLTAVITGTAAWEAILLKRPALVIGDFPYSALGQGFVQCTDLSKLPATVSQALTVAPVDDERLTIYLAALFDLSFDFPTELFWGTVTPETLRANPQITQAIADRLIEIVESDQALGVQAPSRSEL